MMERSTLIGTVLSVVFQNEENGYAVVRLVTDDGELVTATGCIPCAAAGEQLSLTGIFTTHAQYGEQFTAEEVERRLPSSEEDILTYLASGSVRGIGPATAQKLVEHFGAETLEVLECEPERLTKIRGVTAKRAQEMAESFREQMGLRRLMEFLTRYDLPVSLVMGLYRRYGGAANEAVRANPYVLSGAGLGVDFSIADTLAISLGFSADDERRIEAGVLFELQHNAEAGGHVFLPREKLVLAAAQLLEISQDAAEKALDGLIDRGAVVTERIANVDGCYLRAFHEAETFVTARLLSMLRAGAEPLRGAERAIEAIERAQGIEYAILQRRAVEFAAKERVLLLTGGPGTGKTTCVRGIVALFERMGLDVALAAPTGRAAKRMGELCGREAQTIHRLLEAGYDKKSGEMRFARCEKEPLDADALIVDETSMVDLSLMAALLAALKPSCRLVLVGDSDQLPSVGAGNVFSDLLRSERIATVRLLDVFRQAEKSAIIRSAHAVNRGSPPELANARGSDIFFLPRRESSRLVDTVVELCRTRLPDNMGIPVEEIQVICPTRRGDAGTVALNRALQAALNPARADKREKYLGELLLREGDRVMQTKNNYDVLWEKEDGTCGAGVYNGDVGHIARIEKGTDTVYVAFEDRLAIYEGEMLFELELAYAMTVHKSQGSEYRAVVFVSAPCAPGLMVRGVLYTAITRAKELLVLVGDDSVLRKMAENDRRQKRYSGLRRRLKDGGEE